MVVTRRSFYPGWLAPASHGYRRQSTPGAAHGSGYNGTWPYYAPLESRCKPSHLTAPEGKSHVYRNAPGLAFGRCPGTTTGLDLVPGRGDCLGPPRLAGAALGGGGDLGLGGDLRLVAAPGRRPVRAPCVLAPARGRLLYLLL